MSEYQALGGTIRKFWPGEMGAFRDHLMRLDADSRRLRFGGITSDAFIEDYCETARRLGTVVYAYFLDTRPVAVAEMRWLFDHHPVEAEVAITVELPYRDQGIGSALMGRIIKAARNRHVRKLHMICLAENVRMQQVARKHRALLVYEHGSISGELDPAHPTPFTLWLEGLDEGSGYIAAVHHAFP